MAYTIGVDYGTNSVRALVVDTRDGSEIGVAVSDYSSGDSGVLLDPSDPHLARQNPADYILGFKHSVLLAIEDAKKVERFDPEQVVGIGVDTTGSTPLPINQAGEALGTVSDFQNNLAAQAWLWKDHTSFAEAAEITRAANDAGLPYLKKCGGIYSSEWYWAKILHCLRTAPEVAQATATWVELADFVPAYLCGVTDPSQIPRGICAAGHKAMYNEQWGGLPSVEFLESLESGLSRFRYTMKPVPSSHRAGTLIADIADQVGLPAGIPVAIGAFDAHMGAVGAGCGKGTLVKIMGTSTCDCMPAPMDEPLADIPGLCGIVPESILPGMYGLEAGQSAVGDIFNWFVRNLTPIEYGEDHDEAHRKLSEAAAGLRPGSSGLLALDWNNGNRTVLVDPLLSGLLVGQTLHTSAPEIYRALIEATAFGALTIINRMEDYGVKVERVINCGGIAEKNPLVMQIYADVCNRPMQISRSPQTCALGAAIFGAVVAGKFDSVEHAQSKMTGIKEQTFVPIPEHVAIYKKLYSLYMRLHDNFGTNSRPEPMNEIMKDLILIRNASRNETRSEE